MKTPHKIGLAAIGLILIFFVLGSLSGVKVEIVNLGPLTLQDVSVDVQGASYSLGDIESGASRSVKVAPQGESSVSVNHTDHSGSPRTLKVDTYIESGYSGKIKVQVQNGKILHVDQKIKLTPLF